MRNPFKRAKYPTRKQAQEALHDAIYTCGVVMGPHWVSWQLTNILGTLAAENSSVLEAWTGLHAIYAFSQLPEEKR